MSTATESFQRKYAANWATRFALGAAFLAMISQLTFADPDMFHGLALIREAIRSGGLPTVDPFAYTPTVVPFVHHEWGAGAVLYAVLVWGELGATGLMLLKYGLTVAIVVGCFVCARRGGGTEAVITILAPIAMMLGWVGFTTIRAQLYTMWFLVVLMLMLQSDRRGGRWWALSWLGVYVVWLNIHGGFLAGAGLLLIHTVEQWLRTGLSERSFGVAFRRHYHLVLVLVAMACLVVVNPYGMQLIAEVLSAARMDRSLIPEWGPLWSSPNAPVLLIAFVLSLVALLPALQRERAWNLPGLPLVLVTAWLALSHIRHGSIYAIVWICLVPGYLKATEFGLGWSEFWEKNRRGLAVGGLLAGVVFSGIAVRHRFWELKLPVERPIGALQYPAGAVDYLGRHEFQGNLMTPFVTGAYVTWRLYPQVLVSIDSRYEAAYPPEALVENARFYRAHSGWEQTLERYETDAVLVPRSAAIGAKLDERDDWVKVYVDGGYSVFARASVAERLPLETRVDQQTRCVFP